MKNTYHQDDTTRLDVDRLLAALMDEPHTTSAPERQTTEIAAAQTNPEALELFEALSERQRRIHSEEIRIAEQQNRIRLESQLVQEQARRLELEDRLLIEQGMLLALERRVQELEAHFEDMQTKARTYAMQAQAEHTRRKEAERRILELESQLAAYAKLLNGE